MSAKTKEQVKREVVTYSDYAVENYGQVSIESPSGSEKVGDLFVLTHRSVSIDSGATWNDSIVRAKISPESAANYSEQNYPSYGNHNSISNSSDLGVYEVEKIQALPDTKKKRVKWGSSYGGDDCYHTFETNRRKVTYKKI